MDAFDTLGIEACFDLDLSLLSRQHRELSRALHPDKFVNSPRGERRQALGRAIEVNEAYRSVKNPLTRGELLLRRLNLSLSEGDEPSASPELLMEMMEKREELRNAGRKKDVPRVEALAAEMRTNADQLNSKLAHSFRRALDASKDRQDIEGQSIHQDLAALRFYRRFFDEVDVILDEVL